MPLWFKDLAMSVAFVGVFVICPLTYMFLRHQRSMMEVIHSRTPNDTLQRLDALERQMHALTAAHQERVLNEDDQQELRGRIG